MRKCSYCRVPCTTVRFERLGQDSVDVSCCTECKGDPNRRAFFKGDTDEKFFRLYDILTEVKSKEKRMDKRPLEVHFTGVQEAVEKMERLEGAFQVVADALGVSTEELGHMLHKGNISTENTAR